MYQKKNKLFVFTPTPFFTHENPMIEDSHGNDIFIFIIRMIKQRPEELNYLAQGHTAIE